MRRSQPQSSSSPAPRGGSLPGFMFMSDKNTLANCLDNNIFGLPRNMFNKMDNIGNKTLLFLANKDTKEIFGVYLPDGRPALNIDPNVYAPLSFPAQIRIQRTRLDSKVPRARLSWPVRFGPLTFDQVHELEEVFADAAASSSPTSPSSPTSSVASNVSAAVKTQPSMSRPEATRPSHHDSTEQSRHQSSQSRPAQGSGKGEGKGKGDGKGDGKGSGKGESSGKGGSAPETKPLPPPPPSSSSSSQLPLPPDVTVMDLCLKRLDLEQLRLREERRALHGSSDPSTSRDGVPIQPASWTLSWPARYAKLNEALSEAVQARNFVLAASLKQQADDLKAMLEAVAAVANISLAQQYGSGQAASGSTSSAGGGGAAAAAAYCAAADAAALRQDFLTAALLEDAARHARTGSCTTSASSRGTGQGEGNVSSNGSSSSRADPLEAALATLLEHEVGIEPQYAESLFMSGIKNAQQLLACDEATLSAWGFKQEICDKIFQWQATRSNTAPGAAPVAAPVASSHAPATTAPPPRPKAASRSGHGLNMKSEVALVEAITGDSPGLGLSVSTVDLLRAAGVSTLGALVAMSDDALNATGIKKGPRLKIKILCNNLRSEAT